MNILKTRIDGLIKWIDGLIAHHRVFGVQAKVDMSGIASGKQDKFVFNTLARAADLRLDYDVTVIPPKYFFQPPHEVLSSFSSPSDFKSVLDNHPFIVVGVHPYDMAAINQMDKIFASGLYDEHYMARRKNAVVIGCDVQRASENVFAGCMNTAVVKEGFDILLTRLDDGYIAEAFTDTGLDLLKTMTDAREADASSLNLREKIWDKNRKILRKHELKAAPETWPVLLEKSYSHPVWEEKAEKCFSCGSCNLVCPTCYCFDVRDETTWDLKSGERCRVWDGCLLRDFATVAGGHNFRKKRMERYRHRYCRKGKYVAEKIKEISCVGCGRCITACVTKIANPVEIFNRLAEDR